jgi:F-type H+-transporting ATPase subunit b
MMSVRWLLAATLLAALVVGARIAPVSESIGVTAVVAAAQSDAHAHEAPTGKEASGEEHGAGSGWGATIAKMVNFAILVGVLVYFLRTPIAAYLAGRISKVREDLVAARQTRETAARQLAEIDAKLKALPLELEALKQRGAQDIVAERARIEEAAEAERQRLLEHTRREIEMRLRIARRELLELTADRAITVARERITHAITPDDQARLVDRYGSLLQGQAGGARPEVRS